MSQANQVTIDKLLVLAANRFERDPSTLSATDDFFASLGIDSLQALDLLTDVEDAFDVEIPDYELQGVSTFTGLAEVIGRRI